MKNKLLLGLSFLLIVGFTILKLSSNDETAPEEELTTQVISPKPVIKPPSRLVASVNEKGEELKEDERNDLEQKIRERFKAAGLSEVKTQAMFDLENFHQSMPTFNEANIKLREEMLSKLNENPSNTINAFKELVGDSSSNDDLKTFIMNVAPVLNISDAEKAEIFAERISQGAKFREDGSVEDNELSIVIGLSHLSRLQDAEAKGMALEEILINGPDEKNPAYLQLLKDYFPEHKDKIGN